MITREEELLAIERIKELDITEPLTLGEIATKARISFQAVGRAVIWLIGTHLAWAEDRKLVKVS
jgi:hypothetical protein